MDGRWRQRAGRIAAAGCLVALAAGCGLDTAHNGDSPGTSAPSSSGSTATTAKPAPRDAVHQLLAADGRAGDNFGGAQGYDTFSTPVTPVYFATPGEAALSSDGTVAVVGAPGAPGGPNAAVGAGAVYVFARSGDAWTQVAKLVAPDGAKYDALGWSVAISGDGHQVVAGAPYADLGAFADVGAAYSFSNGTGTWSKGTRLLANDSRAYDGFGWSVGIARDGRHAIVGATGHDAGFYKDAGAAYVFRHLTGPSRWIATHTLSAPKPRPAAEFGGAVALSATGTTAVATELTHFDADHKLHTGATYIFVTHDGWAHAAARAKFADPNHNANGDTDAYGVNAVLSDDGTLAAIAAPDVNIGTARGAGAVYLYRTNGDWSRPADTEHLELLPTTAKPFLYYGSAVALSADGSRLFVGIDGDGVDDQGSAERAELSGESSGALRAVTRTAVAPPNETTGRFGTAVAIAADGSGAIATAPWLTVDGAAKQGAAYLIDFTPRTSSP